MQTGTTRRALLTAAIVLPAVATIPAAAAIPLPVDRSEWDRAFAQMTALKQQSAGAFKRWKAAWAEAETTKPDPSQVDTSAFNGVHPFNLNTIDIDKHEAGMRAAIGQTWFPTDRELESEAASYESVRSYQRSRDANFERYGMEGLDDELSDLGEAESAATIALLRIAAPDLAAVHWKLNFLFDGGEGDETSGWSMDIVLPVLADVKRFADMEGR